MEHERDLPQQLVDELVEEGLPVLKPYLSASVKIKESHNLARPMIHLDPRHKLTQEFVALHEEIAGPVKARKQRKSA